MEKLNFSSNFVSSSDLINVNLVAHVLIVMGYYGLIIMLLIYLIYPHNWDCDEIFERVSVVAADYDKGM